MKLRLPEAYTHPAWPQHTVPSHSAWTESEWEGHMREVGEIEDKSAGMFWLLLLVPFPVAFLVAGGSLGPVALWAFVGCAIAAGFLSAKRSSKNRLEFALTAVVGCVAMLLAYVALAGFILFAGCLLL